MSLFSPRYNPWKIIKGYESVDEFKILSHPVTSQTLTPCYVPDRMCTTPLKFPSFVTGTDHHPIHVARTALGLRYTSDKYLENKKNLVKDVSSVIKDSEAIGEHLDNLVRLAKETMKTCDETGNDTKKTEPEDECINCLKLKLKELSLKLEEIITDNKNLQNFKRKLQVCKRNIRIPLHISTECLQHRETRNKIELLNDKVEQMLMKEITYCKEKQEKLKKYLQQCENQIITHREIQKELENLIKHMEWVLFIDNSKEDLKKFSESKTWVEKSEIVLETFNTSITESQDFQKKIKVKIDDLVKNINDIWTETNNAFEEKTIQLKETIYDVTCFLNRIKNEISHVEENIKYLKNHKEFRNSLHEGESHLKTLLETKTMLETELKIKIKSLFIDDHKCMTVRKCYPISSIIQF